MEIVDDGPSPSEEAQRKEQRRLQLIPNDQEAMKRYSSFCQTRYAQLLRERPDLANDKEKLAGIIAAEWSEQMT